MKNKLIMLGDSGVGKTSLVRQWVQHSFIEDFISPTVGAAYSQTTFTFEDVEETIQIWDTAGEEKYRAMAPMYSQQAFCAVIVFDMTNAQTFDNISQWIQCIPPKIPIAIAGNKADLVNLVVKDEEAMKFANSINSTFYRTSALSGLGVQDMFENLLQTAFKTRKQVKTQTNSNAVEFNQKDQKKSNCC